MGNDNFQSNLTRYYNAFSNFANYINLIHNQLNPIENTFEGYFVELNSYNQVLNTINRLINNSSFNDEKANNQLYKLKTININKIMNPNERMNHFIIINKELYNEVCEKNDENKITYRITPEKIILILKNGETKEFKNNKNNIIDKSSFLTETYNINEYSIMNSSQKYQEYKERTFVNNYEKYQGDNRTILHNSLFNLSNQYENQQHRNHLASITQQTKYQRPIMQKINYNSSERLKILALLAVSQFYSIKENKLRKVFLINPEWLEYYKYSEIKNIVNEIYQKFAGHTQFWNKSYELNSVSTILSQVNDDKIKELEKNINIENKKQYYCNPEIVNIQGKPIPLYKRFILIYEQFHDHFRKYFSIKTNYDILYYKNEYEEDYIILENYRLLNQNYYGNYNNNVLNIILFGDILLSFIYYIKWNLKCY